MIKKLTIGGVASYKTPVEIDNLGRYNFFYGLNGSGKTTITRFLANPDDEKYRECCFEKSESSLKFDILVYNRDYVERNFHETDALNGVFVLDELNKAVWETIERAKSEVQKREKSIEDWGYRIARLESKIEKARIKTHDDVWKFKASIDKDKISELTKGSVGSKEKFYEKIVNRSLSDSIKGSSSSDFRILNDEYEKLLKADGVQRPPYNPLEWTEVSEDVVTLLEQQITSSQDSYLSELIQLLQHEDWVRKGIPFLDEVDECPFCKQGIEAELKDKIRGHFDEFYKQKLSQVQNVKSSYEQSAGRILKDLKVLTDEAEFSSNAKFVRIASEIKEKINVNLSHLNKKYESPNLSIEIYFIQYNINEVNMIIDEVNRDIEAQNERIKNVQKFRDGIRERLWDMLRHKSNEIIIKYEADLMPKNEMLKSLESKVEAAKIEIIGLKKEIESNYDKVKNIDKVVESINRRLLNFGFDGFQIVKTKSNDNLPELKVSRNGDNCSDSKFESLSEGERTLISFLYFIEECKGARGDENTVNLSKRIVVIDDPISSLSFNLVFNIASLVRGEFLAEVPKDKGDNFCQIFIFTHHLYFFHEIIPRKKESGKGVNGKKLFRVCKSDNVSQVCYEEKFSINNNYDEFWALLREIRAGKISKIALPNIMRNILEYFFAFTYNASYKTEIENLAGKINDEGVCLALLRYVNRESHSDGTNLLDTGDIDVEIYIECLAKIFEASGYSNHFDVMMGQEAVPPPAPQNSLS